VHEDPTHNFTVQRLIILNDNNEMLMLKVADKWFTPSIVYEDREYLKEGLDNLSKEYGITTTSPELRGHFSYKYDYHPYATLRTYFVANYVSGEIQIPEGMQDAQWVPVSEAMSKTPVKSINQITEQIIKFPNVVWGASFMISDVDGEHPSKLVEDFYPLFKR
jgi:hypothetical protein